MIAALLVLLLSVAPVTPYTPDAEIVGPMDFDSLGSALVSITKAAEGGKKDLVLRISSPGGEVLPTLLFLQMTRDELDKHRAHLTCVADIMAASAAAFLLESDVCSRRVAYSGTLIMFHGVRGQIAGTVREMEDELKLYRDLDLLLAEVISGRLGIPVAAYQAMILGHDLWLTPSELQAMGGLDEVAFVRHVPVEAPAESGMTP